MAVTMADGGDEETRELDLLTENLTRILEEEDSKVYSREVTEEFRHPSNIERMRNADGEGAGDGICGDSMEIYIKVKDGTVERCTFFTDGCGVTIACGSRLTRLVTGMALDDAKAIKPSDLVSLLRGLPEEHIHCASLTVIALKNAIRNYESRRRRSEGVIS